jgi:hypothetical protein
MTHMCSWCAQSYEPRPGFRMYCSDRCVDAAIEESKAMGMRAYPGRRPWYERRLIYLYTSIQVDK